MSKLRAVFTTNQDQSSTNSLKKQGIWLKACYRSIQSKDLQLKQHLLTNGSNEEELI